MTRLRGPGRSPPWLWIILLVVLIVVAILLLDYFDVIPLHFI